jgi:hypothetical protein
MTPRLRSLYEGAVVPLLTLLTHEQLVSDRQAARCRSAAAVQDLTSRLEAAHVALQGMKEGTDKHWKLEKRAGKLQQRIARQQIQLVRATHSLAKIEPQLARTRASHAVVAAVAELEAPILLAKPAAAAAAAPSSSSSAAAASAAAVAAGGNPGGGCVVAAGSKAAARAPKQARRAADDGSAAGQVAAQQEASCLVDLLMDHADPTTTVLDFVGGASSLGGIGATAHALRAAVKACLPRLALTPRRAPVAPLLRLGDYPRLLHLAVHKGYSIPAALANGLLAEMVQLGLPARLESLIHGSVHGQDTTLIDALVSHEWPQLRVLEVGSGIDSFFDSVAARPGVVFPRLHTLVMAACSEAQAGKLLALLERGAFPALVSVHRNLGVVVKMFSSHGATAQCALLSRLPETQLLHLDRSRNLTPDDFFRSTALFLEGRLAKLKCVLCAHVCTSEHAAARQNSI